MAWLTATYYGLGCLLHAHPVASRQSVAQWQAYRSPRVIRATFLLMPVGSTSQRSVQVSGFGDYGHLTPLRRLIRFLFVRPAFCLGLPSDSQSPATPLPSANTSPCRVCRGLSPPSRQAHHHSEPDSASHGATRHAWRTIKKRQHMAGENRSVSGC